MEYLIALLVISLIGAIIWWNSRHHQVPPVTSFEPALFKPKALLTENELEFLIRLEKAVPELRFHTQVAMGALISPTVSRYHQGSDFFRLRSQFSQKIVDFVAQHRENGQVIAVIELDDRTHDVQKDEQRDNMLRQAGYRVIRWHSKNKPDTNTIRRELLDLLETGLDSSILSAALARFR